MLESFFVLNPLFYGFSQQNNDRLRNNDGEIEAGTEEGISNYDDEPENEDDYPLRWPEPSRTPDDYNYFW